jgi:ADP-heptose:LPS heptosyltransferase
VDKVLIFKKGLSGFLAINKIVKLYSIKVVVDLHDDVSTSVSYLVALSNVGYKFALKKSNYRLFTHTVDKLDSRNNHVIDRVLELLRLFNVKLNRDLISVKYYPNEVDKRIASDKIKSLNPDNKFLIGINISAGSDARFWGVDNYKKLFSFLSQYEARIILFSSQREHQYCFEITSSDNIYPITESFGIFASAIMMMNFIITPDTSVVHLASINKIPLFGLYVKFNTEDLPWYPYNTDFEYVLTEEPTLKNIPFDEVKSKLIPFLEKHLNVTSST